MTNVSIKLKVTGMLVASTLFIVILTVANFTILSSTTDKIDNIKKNNIELVKLSYSIRYNSMQTYKSLTNIALIKNGQNITQASAFVNEFNKDIKAIKLIVDKNSYSSITSNIDEIQTLFLSFYSSTKNISNNYNNSNYMSTISSKSDNLNKAINKLLNNVESITAKNIKNYKDDNNSATKTIAILGALLTIILLVIGTTLINNINKSLSTFKKGLNNFFRFLNKETDHAEKIDVAYENDEIGKMANVINSNIVTFEKGFKEDEQMIENSAEVAASTQRGHLSHRIEKNAHNPSLNRLKDVINNMIVGLEQNTIKNLDVLQAFAQNDYRSKVTYDKDFRGKQKILSDGINHLSDALSQISKDNMQNGITLKQQSQSLTSNVTNLTNATNNQASSLEDISNAIAQLSTSITENTQKAIQMTDVTSILKKSADQGDKFAKDTVKAMDEINSATSSIYESIDAIDQIAFQTNILSLNAAVEAATAGETGKGFAVVAGEVRNLASRSSEAAKEIQHLVEQAQTKANEGKNISDNMIKGYESLNENIKQTSELVVEVSNTTKEQSNRVSDINSSISNLDAMTQNNVKIAKETSNIANQTIEMAQKLVDDANSKEFIGKDSLSI
jgi:methyl-accepting chemotaxis protein